MIDTAKVIGFYVDVFGNEIDEYEQIERYTDGINEHGYDSWEDAIALYNFYGNMIHIEDNKYGMTFSNGDWY